MKKTKADLERENAELRERLGEETARPTGHTITGCTIKMSDPDPTAIAVAEAVTEAMKALQKLASRNSYGIYLAGNDR